MGMLSVRSHRWWLIAIILISAGLAARLLAVDILFVDEYWSIRNSGGTFGPLGIRGIWERTATLDPGGMGVLYHWLLGAWEYLIGISTFSVRAFSLLFGVLTIAALYRLGTELFSSRIGFYAASILALSAFFIDYMHEARAYTLLAFFTVIAVYCYHRIMHRDKANAGWYIGLALSLAALAYTHYVALAMGLVLGLYHLLNFRLSRKWWLVVVAMAIGGVLFLPWLTVTLEVIQRGTEDTGRQSDSMTTLAIVQNFLHMVSNANLALFALLAFLTLRQFSKKVALIWIWILASLVLVILVNTVIPFMVHLRYLLFVFPAIALLMAIGISRLKNFALAVLLVWLGAGIYQSLEPSFIDDQFGQIYRAPANGFHRALDVLNQRAEADDLALFHIMQPTFESFNFFPLDYYFVETDLVQTDVRFEQVERVANSFVGGDVEYLADVEDAFRDVETIWTSIIPDLLTTQRSGVINYVLATQFADCGLIFSQEDMEMRLYARPPQTDAIATYGDDVISLYDLGHVYQSEEHLDLLLGWWAENTPNDIYSVGVHLFDSDGNLVRQVDFGLPNERPFVCNNVRLDLAELPAGEYIVRVTVYEWQTGDRLLLADDSDYVDFQMITIDVLP